MTTPISLRLLSLLGLSLLALSGCGGGGGGTASTVLTFIDDSSAPVPGGPEFTGQVTGGSLTAARNVNPDASGKLSIDLAPGTYTVQAAYKSKAQLISLTTNTNFTVNSGDSLKVQNIKLSDTDLAAGWTKYRASDFVGALASFNTYHDRAAQGNFGSTAADNALGWTLEHTASNFNESVAKFTDARTENPNNTDANVGLAGILLARNATSDPGNAKDLLTIAIGVPGDYTSAPWHDSVKEGDLIVCRALAEFIQGDKTAAAADLDIVRPNAVTGTSRAGGDLFRTLDLLLKN